MYDALTGNIDLGEALKCLRNGKLVARRDWPQGMHLYLDDDSSNGIIFRRLKPGFIEGWAPGLRDLTAQDYYEITDAVEK